MVICKYRNQVESYWNKLAVSSTDSEYRKLDETFELCYVEEQLPIKFSVPPFSKIFCVETTDVNLRSTCTDHIAGCNVRVCNALTMSLDSPSALSGHTAETFCCQSTPHSGAKYFTFEFT